MQSSKQGTTSRLLCVTIADLDGFKISQMVGALHPASIVGGQASLAPMPQGNPGVKLSQRLSIMKALHHTFFTKFFSRVLQQKCYSMYFDSSSAVSRAVVY
jgi:hypothetical protein